MDFIPAFRNKDVCDLGNLFCNLEKEQKVFLLDWGMPWGK